MKPILCSVVICETETHIFRFLVIVLLLTAYVASVDILYAQEETAPGKYRIEFTDKDNSPFSLEKPAEFLSPRALQRRQKQNIPLDDKDIPVNPDYIDIIRSFGVRILIVSRWFNAVTIANADTTVLASIMNLPFVKQGIPAYLSLYHATEKDRVAGIPDETSAIDYGYSAHQIAIHNGDKLHDAGYTGKGIHIAVIDAGFHDVDNHVAFSKIWLENRMLGYRDFVNPGSSFFDEHTHGKTVLSVIGGLIPEYFCGTAPDASFWLLRSEDVSTEYRIEEDNWIAAAEFADSAGVDIINTSLGYSTFSNPSQDYTYADMDGNSTRISIAADIAASRGILVVVSAGNEGSSLWRHITAPSDADSILSVGAIDSFLVIASFSGQGPSYDKRVKPDICAMGVRTYGIGTAGALSRSNGTSFSAPIISGLAACLWQANPEAGVMDIQQAIRESADRYNQPDTLYGYGIPDFNLAGILLKRRIIDPDPENPVTVFPNPFFDEIYIWLNKKEASEITVTLYDLSGRAVYIKNQTITENEEYLKVDNRLNMLPQGMYLMNIRVDNWQHITRLLKL
ncbi:MAG: S8 family serine peptidase [Bacteroidales bacterium]|nr:S8 family serine peptidase [Bacteroidales bacterium]